MTRLPRFPRRPTSWWSAAPPKKRDSTIGMVSKGDLLAVGVIAAPREL
ncbi:MAG TPA: hypothetical protein VND96_00110 [Candidatus Micrarchaeaceae archaeon]|nr:hypothetical protein [Candidatus Micrarchaeaceae archaeon]